MRPVWGSARARLMSSRFQRFLLPGLAFKAVVIGGGYATGRELAEFFLPSGPWGGIAAMVLATVIWSAVCVATFLFARASRRARLPDLRARAARTRLGGVRGRVCALRRADPRGVRRRGGRDRRGDARAARRSLGTLSLMAAIALVTAFGNAVRRAPLHLRVVPAVRRSTRCSCCSRSRTSAIASRTASRRTRRCTAG